MAHINHMAALEPTYAAKALKWYDRMLPWLGLMPDEQNEGKV